MTDSPPLVVLILGGAAERLSCPAAESPLALARTPWLDRLAREGRVFAVRLVEGEHAPYTAAPHLSILGIDPAAHATARASYMGVLAGERLAPEECFVSADFAALFRNLVADAEPSPLRAAETTALLAAAGDAVRRAGFRLVPGAGAHHLAIAPRASVDAETPSPEAILGKPVEDFEPRVEQHAFAHRLARDVLEKHELNEVRRDLGRNGADLLWLWGPGGEARIDASWEDKVAGLGTDPVWRGVCRAASVPVKTPKAATPAALVRALAQAVRTHRVCFLHVRRATSDALLRERALRVAGIADLDEKVVGPVAELVARRRARLLVLPEAARDTASGAPLGDPVPALLWGAGVRAVSARPFTEEGAASAGEPLAPGHGLLAYVRHV